MKHHQVLNGIIFGILIAGCASVPQQVVDAIEVQQIEIDRVKEIYFTNLNNQLDAIEKYQLAILDIYEEQFIKINSKALDEVTINGVTELKETNPTGDPNVDHINIGKLKDITAFFKAEREKVQNDINARREMVNKANQNFENIEQINLVVHDYFQSLSRLKKSQDKLAQAIKTKIEKLAPIPVAFLKFPAPLTFEELRKTLNDN